MKVLLKDAYGAADFLFAVYSTRAEEISFWGWSKEAAGAFLFMQYEAQQRSYQQQYPGLTYRVIWADGQKAGFTAFCVMPSALAFVDIALLPSFRNKGIGSKILKMLQDKAGEQHIPICLSVFNGNKARRLYERFGFQSVADSGVYTTMQWFSIEKLEGEIGSD